MGWGELRNMECHNSLSSAMNIMWMKAMTGYYVCMNWWRWRILCDHEGGEYCVHKDGGYFVFMEFGGRGEGREVHRECCDVTSWHDVSGGHNRILCVHGVRGGGHTLRSLKLGAWGAGYVMSWGATALCHQQLWWWLALDSPCIGRNKYCVCEGFQLLSLCLFCLPFRVYFNSFMHCNFKLENNDLNPEHAPQLMG